MSEHINLADIRTAILRAKDRNEKPTLITISYEDFMLLALCDEFTLNLEKDYSATDAIDYRIFGIDLYADRFRPAGYLKVEGEMSQ